MNPWSFSVRRLPLRFLVLTLTAVASAAGSESQQGDDRVAAARAARRRLKDG